MPLRQPFTLRFQLHVEVRFMVLFKLPFQAAFSDCCPRYIFCNVCQVTFQSPFTSPVQLPLELPFNIFPSDVAGRFTRCSSRLPFYGKHSQVALQAALQVALQITLQVALQVTFIFHCFFELLFKTYFLIALQVVFSRRLCSNCVSNCISGCNSK